MEFPRLLGIIENYWRFEKEAEEKSYRERFRSRVDEIVSNISAREYVMRKLQGEEKDEAASRALPQIV